MAINVDAFIKDAISEISREVKGRAIIGLSGGVDSSVCAILAHRALEIDWSRFTLTPD